MNTFEIVPFQSYGQIRFGMFIDQVVELIGEPDLKEVLDMVEDGNNHVVYRFDSLNLNLYFEGVDKSVLACVETSNVETVIFGKRIFDMDQNELVSLFEENGHKVDETEEEDDETRMSFDKLGIDLFFAEDELVAVCFGVRVDRGGNIVN